MKIVQKSNFPIAEFEVSIVSANNTVHRVFLTSEYYQELTAGKIEAEELIRRSFEFLLERESNTAILSEFDLKKITDYFSEFENVIGTDL